MNEKNNNLSDVGVVVLSYNRVEELKNNIASILVDLLKYGCQVIIVDNFSTDGSREYLESLADQHRGLVLIFNDSNLGVAGGRNAGRNLIGNKFILHLDDDTKVAIEDIEFLCEIMENNQDIGVLSPKIIHPLTLQVQNEHGVGMCDVGNYHGACHLVRKEAMTLVGDIDPLCVFGGEELDYSIRMKAVGYRVCYTSQVTVFHNSMIRDSPEAKWRRKKRVYNFSRIHFKHFPAPLAVLFSTRYFFSHFLSAMRYFGFLFSLSLFFDLYRGVCDGRRNSKIVPKNVVEYYSRKDIGPDYGNVPLSKKIFNKFM